MEWKKILKKLESNKEWDLAIEFMVDYINRNPEDLDAYLNICYLLMNLLVEEDYNRNNRDYYISNLKYYFDQSYSQFSHNTEYLYYMGLIACMSEWYVDLELEEAIAMMEEAAKRDPNNLIYQWDKYYILAQKNPIPVEVMDYAKLVLQENSPIKKILRVKGSLGEYLLGMMTSWSKRVLEGKVLRISQVANDQ